MACVGIDRCWLNFLALDGCSGMRGTRDDVYCVL